MIFHSPADIPGGYDHVYLAPHLDDAALSCGGAIAGQRAAGQRVLVVALCTAAPDPGADFSALARAFHREWRLTPAQAVAARLDEERAALAILGADGLWAGMLDAIYRSPEAYHSRATLFAPPDAADPLLPTLRELIAALRARLPEASFYAPLGVGGHVDHQITCRAALERAGPALALYEDFPYVARAGELERRLASLALRLEPMVIPIAAGLPQKIAAVQAYASQMAELAHSQLGRMVRADAALAAMAEAVAGYAQRVGGERLWVPA
jgi:LmbE family N-acetylglucosaminyl deacetylase